MARFWIPKKLDGNGNLTTWQGKLPGIFKSIKTIDNNGLNSAFHNCTGIKEIHFRVDTKSIVEKQADYSNKFGATNATIYFDL